MSGSLSIDSDHMTKEPEPQRRTKRLTIRFTPDELADINDAAGCERRDVADVIRLGSLDYAHAVLRRCNRPSRVTSEEAGDGRVELPGSPDSVPEALGKTGKGKRAPGA